MSEPLALYIHWPFCLAKCPYCDFNSHVADGIDQARWRRALAAEMRETAALTGQRRLVSIFFGGGTPSLMAPETVADLIETATALWSPADDLEVTLEANPTSAEAARFSTFAATGINRLSLGVQSFDDAALAFLGRRHSAAAAQQALDAATIFPRHSFDLIYARPGQTAAAWRAELGQALALADGHLSLYQLTIEPGTAFFRDRVPTAEDDRGAELYELTQDMAAKAGLPAYEVSNHARPGDACRHNVHCWRGVDYAGIGPGAHGRLTDAEGTVATYRLAKPETWLAAVERRGTGTAKMRRLTVRERGEELLLTGLRLTEGIDTRDFQGRSGIELAALIDADAVARLVDGSFIERPAGRFAATAAGRLRLNALLDALLAPVAAGAEPV